jgi:SAM-dependent methyltransferase
MECLTMTTPTPGPWPSPITALLADHLTPEELAGPPRVSVWACAQQHPHVQRSTRYLPETAIHPGAMLPELARHVIETYTHPGEIILDPLCGTGTVLVEASHAGRTAIGIESNPRHAQIAARNLERAKTEHEAPGTGYVWQHPKPTTIPAALYEHYQGRIALALTSLPTISSRRSRPSRCSLDTVSSPASNSTRDPKSLMLTFTDVLRATRELLKPGGLVAVAARTQRHRGHLVDYPSAVISAGRLAGLIPVDRTVILTHRIAADGDSGSAPACPLQATRHRTHGRAHAVVVHRDLLVFSV